MMELRKGVTHKKDDVWRMRGGVDMYTLDQDLVSPEVDHIVEVSLLQQASLLACVSEGAVTRGRGMAYRQAEEYMQSLTNEMSNLNVTSKVWNRKKSFPFQMAWNEAYDSFEDIIRTNRRLRVLLEEGVWPRIQESVVLSWESMKERIEEDTSSEEKLMRNASLLIKSMSGNVDSLFERKGMY